MTFAIGDRVRPVHPKQWTMDGQTPQEGVIIAPHGQFWAVKWDGIDWSPRESIMGIFGSDLGVPDGWMHTEYEIERITDEAG